MGGTVLSPMTEKGVVPNVVQVLLNTKMWNPTTLMLTPTKYDIISSERIHCLTLENFSSISKFVSSICQLRCNDANSSSNSFNRSPYPKCE
ncbi:Uncharacterised protein [uncultured archaeon]|nr:Uncharacterised protein [uncultured archaeon]